VTYLARRRFVLAALLLVVLALGAAPPASAETVLVFAAASLRNALDDAVAAFGKESGDTVQVSYAASSALARQLDSGAPADLFISADIDWMDYAQQHKLIRADTRKDLLGNRLVLIAPADSTVKVEIKPGFPLAHLLGGGRLSVADDAVPAGKYGKAALEKLGVWASVADHLARAQDVRGALFYVSRREAPLGIVYETDAAADRGVKIVGVFPADTHPPIIYPIALTASSKSPAAPRLLHFLESPAAKPFFEKQGFTVLP
jgi:molybdate transport system substrate-binding protein